MIFTNKEIIHPKTLELLIQLQSDPFLQNFFLVGGTSLALDFKIEKPILHKKISFKKVKERLIAASKAIQKIF